MSEPQSTKTSVCFVVAVANNGVIGRDGSLPWRMPSDLRTFRRLTMGKPLIMGRRTFNSLKQPLQGRDNIVVTRHPETLPEGTHGAADPATALGIARDCARTRGVAEIMVIGGAEIFAALLDQANRIYLTRINAAPDGNTFFPAPDPAVWQEVSRTPVDPDPRDEHTATLIVLERRSTP